MAQPIKKPLLFGVPSAAVAAVAVVHPAVIANSMRSKGVSFPPTAVVTKQVGDAQVAQDSKINMVIAGLERVEQEAIVDRANTNNMFKYICEKLEKMDSKGL
jgi:hypothetical protein